ncbi:hypothetical protein ACFWP5_29980 [Streptomyces sp. NPDC058469]|uniref:hypothetical protein n=1 Tax=Streptomyces sp. NPDC058469 TaxID=3346514 RepID=UPI0036673A1B
MTQTPHVDVPVTDSAMLSFDGRVLEVFGYVDAARYHVWEEPRIEFRTGRIRRLTITTKHGRRHSVLYDAHRLPELQALVERLERSGPEGSEP